MSYQVREVFEKVRANQPAPRRSTDDIIASARRMRARRRVAVTGGAAGVLAVTVAAGAVFTGGGAPPAQPPGMAAAAPSSPSAARVFTQPAGFESTLGAYRVGRYQIGPVNRVTQGYQELPVYRDGYTISIDGTRYPLADAVITAYRPGVFDLDTFGVDDDDTTTFGKAEPVTIAGMPGFTKGFTFTLPNLEDLRAKNRANGGAVKRTLEGVKQDSYTRTAVAWQYAPDAWATFLPARDREPMTRADTFTIIEGVTPAPAAPVKAPYRIGHLPSGWQIVAATQAAAGVNEVVSEIFLHEGPLSRAELGKPLDDSVGGGVLRIYQGKPKAHNTPRGDGSVRCHPGGSYCTRLIDGNHFAQLQATGGNLPTREIERTLRGLTFTAVADQDAWVPVS